MEIDWQLAIEENSLPDLIGPEILEAGCSNQSEEELNISLNSPILADLIDFYTYDQLATDFAACLQKLEMLTGYQQATEEQIQQLELNLVEMQSELVQMRQAMAKAFTAQKRTEKQYIFAQSTANNWQPRAHIALQKGNEDLAKEALFRQKANGSIAASLRLSLDWQLPALDTLKQNIVELEIKTSETKTKKELLAAIIDAKATWRIETAFKARLQQLAILTNGENFTDQVIQNLEWLIEQMQLDLVYIRACTAKTTAAKKHIQKQFYLAQSLAKNWERRAHLSGKNRDDVKIKEWSIRQKADSETAAYLKSIDDLQTSQLEFLKYNLISLKIAIFQVKTEKELMKVSASLQHGKKPSDRLLNPSDIPALSNQQSDILIVEKEENIDDFFKN